MPSLLTSVNEAKQLLGQSGVVFIDTRNYWRYEKGHIPRAHNLELYAFHWVDTSSAGIKAYANQMGALFSSFGIDNSKRVIFYQNNSGYDAARGVWLINFLGHKNASMLNGGLNLWKRMKLPISKDDPEAPKRGNFVPRIHRSVVATFQSLQVFEGKLLDVRTPGEYSGKYRRALKSGHIPGAINIEWKQSLRRDGTIKSSRELKRLFKDFNKRDEIVTYCQSGYRAAHSYLVLKSIGFTRVRNYLGSWYEWGNAVKKSPRRASSSAKSDHGSFRR